ncbi:hypothetical protein GPECTOR_19g370 [Gonium pectorale]|uniref:methionine--tRNA ligase n=1 Tax=Gonium pectorale TaxID=33097 RepID=A0A150GJD6_GONPE|nr:hypothetical protein GPECTOR_19g370 [Gonium pectorale]|eukprot:KXZ49919.1 hypothetical protein GPECTOR_19g370 [Gonium pectorale]
MLRAVARRCLPFQPSALPPRSALWAPSAAATTRGLAPIDAPRVPSPAATRGCSVRTCCSSCPSPAATAGSGASGEDYFTITTPLYYVNAAPHMGSAYPTIAADVASRFHRLLGKRVRFLTGTDEHGEKIAAAAARRGMSPQAHCDDIVDQYTDLWGKLMSYVREGLRDFSISRAAVDWGIRMPQDPQHTVYVWFDALIGYLSGLLPADVAPSASSVPSHGWPASVHVIGKDILRFHAIYWPGMLLSAGLPVPGRVYGHGFLTKDGLKMGKALGNTLDPQALVSTYGSDAVRLYFMKEIMFGQDGDFSEARFRDVVNAALANNLGNGLNRTLNLLAKFHDRTIPLDAASLPADLPLRVLAAERLPAAASAYGSLAFHDAAEAVLALASRSNQYLEETQPWTKLKKGTDDEKAEAAAVLVAVLEAVRVVAVGLAPLTPQLSRRIYAQLGYSDQQFEALTWADASWGGLTAGHRTAEPAPVFVRLEAPGEAEAAAQAAAAAAAAKQQQQAKKDKKAKGEGKKQKQQKQPVAEAGAEAAGKQEQPVAA